MFHLIDVTNCNRRKVEISDRSRCVVDVRDRLLLQERVQLGRGTFYTFSFYENKGGNLCCKNFRWSLFSRFFIFYMLWMLAHPLVCCVCLLKVFFSYVEVESISRARSGGNQDKWPESKFTKQTHVDIDIVILIIHYDLIYYNIDIV